jgi:hypothetical protein
LGKSNKPTTMVGIKDARQAVLTINGVGPFANMRNLGIRSLAVTATLYS